MIPAAQVVLILGCNRFQIAQGGTVSPHHHTKAPPWSRRRGFSVHLEHVFAVRFLFFVFIAEINAGLMILLNR